MQYFVLFAGLLFGTNLAGSPVPKVELTATAVATTISFRATSDESGTYVIPNVPIGQFQLRASATGSKQVTRTGIKAKAAQRLRVDIVFEL